MCQIEEIATIRIRPMRQDDIQAVQEIDRASFSLPWPERAFDYELNQNPASMLWVAEIDDSESIQKVVGVLVIWLIIDEAHIATIAIKPGYRRRGIAKKLLERGLNGAADYEYMKTATLEVRASNTAAINLYRSLGFETAGMRPHYYIDTQEDALIMTLSSLSQFKEEKAEQTLEIEGEL